MIQAGDLRSDSLALLNALSEPEIDDVLFVEGVVDAIEHHVATNLPPVVTADERGLTWWHIVQSLAKLRARRAYVGDFRRIVRTAAQHAQELPPADRRVAAIVFIDQTTATAESLSEFREGVLAAQALAPNILHPRLVVRRVLRTALCYVEDEKARVNTGHALRLTVESLAQAQEQSLSLDDLEVLASAITNAPTDVESLRGLGGRLHKKDRKSFLSLFPPAPRP
jgi:hypothetical protein